MQQPGTAVITQRGTFFKAQHLDTGLYIQCGGNSRKPPRLTDSKRCTWFRSFEQAVECLSPLGPLAIEIERHDA